jgi:hypothetical protein
MALDRRNAPIVEDVLEDFPTIDELVDSQVRAMEVKGITLNQDQIEQVRQSYENNRVYHALKSVMNELRWHAQRGKTYDDLMKSEGTGRMQLTMSEMSMMAVVVHMLTEQSPHIAISTALQIGVAIGIQWEAPDPDDKDTTYTEHPKDTGVPSDYERRHDDEAVPDHRRQVVSDMPPGYYVGVQNKKML